jgi:hypothetical protein
VRARGAKLRPTAEEGATLLGYVCLTALASLFLGQDMNWDLLNYHYYNPYMLLTGRIARDVHVAGVQTFLNPLLDIPFYVAVRYSLARPYVIGLCIGAFHGLNLYLVHALVALLFPTHRRWVAWLAGCAAALTSAFGAAFSSEIGTTMNDDTVSVFVLAAIVVLLANLDLGDLRGRWTAPLSGLIAGLATGAKLVSGVYLFGLAAVCLAAPGAVRARARRLGWFALSLTVGVMLTAGYWMWLMHSHFGSPLFPFYNTVFRSPFAPLDRDFAGGKFLPSSVSEALLYPFLFLRGGTLGAELPFRDGRLAAVILVSVLVGVVASVRRLKGGVAFSTTAELRLALLVLFSAVSYVVWLAVFSVYRYAVGLELLASALVVAGGAYLVRRPAVSLLVSIPVCLLLVAHVRPMTWGRRTWEGTFFGVQSGPLERYDHATIVLWDLADRPSGFLVPFFPESTTFVRVLSNWGLTPEADLMWQRLKCRLDVTRRGEMYLLETRSPLPAEQAPQVLAALNLALDTRDCQYIPSCFGSNRLCPLVPVGVVFVDGFESGDPTAWRGDAPGAR